MVKLSQLNHMYEVTETIVRVKNNRRYETSETPQLWNGELIISKISIYEETLLE